MTGLFILKILLPDLFKEKYKIIHSGDLRLWYCVVVTIYMMHDQIFRS